MIIALKSFFQGLSTAWADVISKEPVDPTTLSTCIINQKIQLQLNARVNAHDSSAANQRLHRLPQSVGSEEKHWRAVPRFFPVFARRVGDNLLEGKG